MRDWRLLLLVSILVTSFSARAQKKVISASLENNIIVDQRSNLQNLKWDFDLNQTRIVFNYGRCVMPNGFVTVGLGFEILTIHLLDEKTSRLYSFDSRRLLFPVGFRYSIPVNEKLSISSQLGGQIGLLVSGSNTMLDTVENTYIERKKGVFNTTTGDINFAVGIDRKINSNNILSISPNTNLYITNLLKDGNQLKPTSVGIKFSYLHLF